MRGRPRLRGRAKGSIYSYRVGGELLASEMCERRDDRDATAMAQAPEWAARLVAGELVGVV